MELCTHTMPGWNVLCDKDAGHLGPCSGIQIVPGESYSHRYTWESPFDWKDLAAWALADHERTLQNESLDRATRQKASVMRATISEARYKLYNDGRWALRVIGEFILEGFRPELRGKQWHLIMRYQDGSQIVERDLLLHRKWEAEIAQALYSAAQSRANAILYAPAPVR